MDLLALVMVATPQMMITDTENSGVCDIIHIDFGRSHLICTLANYLQTKRGVRVGARLDARVDSAERWHRALQ